MIGGATGEKPFALPPPVARRELGWAILGCALLATLFLSPALFTGRFLSPADMLYDYYPWYVVRPDGYTRPGNNMLSDSVLQFEPFLQYSALRLHSGALPLWNPDNMLGAPFIGNMQSAVFYPGNWPYFVWPDGSMLVVRAWLKLFIAALGMYLLAREVARAGPLGATVAAVTFAFGAFMMVWLLYPHTVVAWLPWLWWATARLVARPGPRPLAALATLVALSLLAGQPEMAYYLALTTGLFALFRIGQARAGGWRRMGLALGLWVAAYGLGALVAAIQLLPFVEYLRESAALSQRAGHAATSFWLPFRYAWTLISPDLFGNTAHRTWWDPGTNYNESNNYNGILPLLLAPFALFVRDRAQRGLALFLAAGLVVALGIVYHWPVIYDVALALPLMQLGANNRLTVIIQLALALLAALGVEAILARQGHDRRRLLGGLALVTAVLLLGGVGVPWVFGYDYFGVPVGKDAIRQVWQAALGRGAVLIGISGLVLAGVPALGAARPGWRHALPILLPLLLLADVWPARWDYNPTVARADYFRATPVTRFLQAQPGPFRAVATEWLFMPNTNLYYGAAHLGGYDAMEPRLYKELALGIDPTIQPSGAGGLHPFHTVQSPIINLLNVRYVLVDPGVDLAAGAGGAPGPWFRRVRDGGPEDAGIFENLQAQPRAWLTHRAEVAPDPAARLARLGAPDFDRAGTALLAAPLPPDQPLPPIPPAPGADTVTITRYAPEAVEITATSPASGLLILADQVFPGWTATVDGRPAPILTADHALRAVYLPAGAHTVRFVYQPLSFMLGAAGSGMGLLVLVLLAAWPRRRVGTARN